MTETMMLAQVVRGDYPENRFYGWFTVTNHCGNILYSTPGANEISTFFRSAAKPFQFLPSLKANLTQKLKLEEIAIACSSHAGSPLHQYWAEHLLNRVNLTSHHLHCGADIPLDRDTEIQLIRTSNAPNALHNNCSGKHAAMLYYCHQQNYPLDTYLEPNHPLQKEILKLLLELTQLPQIPTAIDGCGAPVFYLPLKAMASLYGLLGSDEEFLPIQNAMAEFPELISGKGRIDTLLMEVTKGKLLSKVGADGLICISRVNQHEGLALKIMDGQNEIRNHYVVWLLHQLHWLSDEEYQHPALIPYTTPSIQNSQSKKIGHYEFFRPEL